MTDLSVRVMDAVDTTNTPFVPVLIEVTDFVTDALLGWTVVVFVNDVDVDSLVSCVPLINFTVNELPDAYRCPYAVPIVSHGISLHPHVSISSPSFDDDT